MNQQLQDAQGSSRITTYSTLATELALQSDQYLTELFKNTAPIGTSIGGTSALL